MSSESWQPSSRPVYFPSISSRKIVLEPDVLAAVPTTGLMIARVIATCSRYDFNHLCLIGRLFGTPRDVPFRIHTLVKHHPQKREIFELMLSSVSEQNRQRYKNICEKYVGIAAHRNRLAHGVFAIWEGSIAEGDIIVFDIDTISSKIDHLFSENVTGQLQGFIYSLADLEDMQSFIERINFELWNFFQELPHR